MQARDAEQLSARLVERGEGDDALIVDIDELLDRRGAQLAPAVYIQPADPV